MISRPNTRVTLLAASIQLALFGMAGHAHADEAVLPTIKVVAAGQDNITGPVNGYVATRSAAGTRTDTPIIETPQSISVVGAEQFTNQGARDLVDALAYTAGVIRLEADDKTTDSFSLRGFQSGAGGGTLYRDGSKFMVNVYDGKQELYGLERIEVLKGAASVLFGAAAPGGIINTVSKRARPDIVNEVNLEVGNLHHKEGSVDLGGAVDPDGKLSWRLTSVVRKSDTMTDYVGDDRVYIAPALTWQPNSDTTLSLLAFYQRDKTAYAYGLPLEGSNAPNPNGQISKHFFSGEPGYDKYDNKQYSIGYILEHRFNDDTKLHHSMRYLKSDSDFPNISLYGWDTSADPTGLRFQLRGAQDRNDRSHMYTTDTSVEHDLVTGSVKHKILAGVDFTSQYHESERYDRTIAPLDMFNPVYGAAPDAERELFDWYPKTKQRRLGLYAQDQMKVGRLVMLAGVRHDNTSETTTPFAPPEAWAKETNSATTGRAGLVYLFDNGIAPFVSWSQSFEPEAGIDKDRNRFKPSRGEQFEAGVRYQPAGASTMLSAVVYQLTQTNVQVLDPNAYPDNPFSTIQQGEMRSRGLELEAATELGKQLKLIAAYAYTDARITRTTTPADLGKRAGSVPYNQASVWADYSTLFGVAGLKGGLGVRYIGETTGNYIDTRVAASTVMDAMVSYEFKNWRLALNARNLTDKEYIASCTYGCFYGPSREVRLSAGYRW